MESWNTFLKNKSQRKEFLFSFTLLILVLTLFFYVLQYIEQRKGFVIEKGWMDFIAAKDFSTIIFTCTYGAIIAGIIFCFRKPSTTLLLIRTFLILQFLRAITLLIVPLDPPQNSIILIDPFLLHTFYNGRANLKDLFFSGHVANIIIFIPIITNKWLKYFLTIAAFIAGVLLACQRVHYILDIIAAPIFSIIAFRIAKHWSAKKLIM